MYRPTSIKDLRTQAEFLRATAEDIAAAQAHLVKAAVATKGQQRTEWYQASLIRSHSALTRLGDTLPTREWVNEMTK